MNTKLIQEVYLTSTNLGPCEFSLISSLGRTHHILRSAEDGIVLSDEDMNLRCRSQYSSGGNETVGGILDTDFGWRYSEMRKYKVWQGNKH